MKKPPGRPKGNVKKSPIKKDLPSEGNPGEFCPCSVYISEEISVGCYNCSKFWHLCCVGLIGLSEENVEKLSNWNCPDCFFSPHSKRFNSASSSSATKGECGTVRVVIKEELNIIQPVIAATVENAVRKCMAQATCTKQDVETVVKTYVEATKQSQKRLLRKRLVHKLHRVLLRKSLGNWMQIKLREKNGGQMLLLWMCLKVRWKVQLRSELMI